MRALDYVVAMLAEQRQETRAHLASMRISQHLPELQPLVAN